MVLSPSDDEHAVAVDVCCSAPSVVGVSNVPATFVHTESDAWMTASISFALSGAVWAAVRIVRGLVPSEVLHWRLIEPGVETSKRVCCGQEVPPDADAACRMSATTVPRSYAPV